MKYLRFCIGAFVFFPILTPLGVIMVSMQCIADISEDLLHLINSFRLRLAPYPEPADSEFDNDIWM